MRLLAALALFSLALTPGAARLQAPAAAPPTFRLALPGYVWHFPADDFAHPAFANEWWYFTGNVAAANGHRYGFELTFFRISPHPGATLADDLYFTHFAISDITGGHYDFTTRARRGAWGQAGAIHVPGGFLLWDENWQAQFDASGPRRLSAAWGNMRLELALEPGRRMLNGIHGWSQKSSGRGQASYYYSYPRLRAQGSVDGAAVSGLVWMDHEFASDQLGPQQQGWDWLGLQLPQGDLMLFNLRLRGGGRDPHSAGTWLPRSPANARGSAPVQAAPQPLFAQDFTMTPLRFWQGYPVAWRVAIPKLGLAFRVEPALDDQLLRDTTVGVTYWEGAVTVPGGGEGYLELTGYGKRFNLLQANPDGGNRH